MTVPDFETMISEFFTALLGELTPLLVNNWIILAITGGVILIISWLLAAAFLKDGIDAGDGDYGTFGKRLLTCLLFSLVTLILPIFGVLIAIKVLGVRHDMNYGKSTLAYLVWIFLIGIIFFLLSLVFLGVFAFFIIVPLIPIIPTLLPDMGPPPA